MQIGIVGMGRMGANMVRRIMRGGHECVVFNRSPASVEQIASEGAVGSSSLDEFAARLRSPRVAWTMLPAGDPTEATVMALAERLEPGDMIIDGGNSHYKDDIRRARALKERGIHYGDVGTSGGIWGLERGYCLMIGGEAVMARHLDPIFRALAPGRGSIPPSSGGRSRGGTAEEGYLHCGPAGAGHFVKMIHNGIEYGLMQAFAEGLDILRNAGRPSLPEEHRYSFSLADITELWRRGSVISSWLLDLTAAALAEDPDLSKYAGFVEDSGEGRWTVLAALEEAVPADVLTAALFARFRSRQEHTFAEKVLSAMREKFGSHTEPPAKDGSR
jgi:6-phosphogluconate dehydrogenase